MKNFKVFFEVCDKKLFTDVTAENQMQAQMQVVNKLKFLEIREVKNEEKDPKGTGMQRLLNEIAIGVLSNEITRLEMEKNNVTGLNAAGLHAIIDIKIKDLKEKLEIIEKGGLSAIKINPAEYQNFFTKPPFPFS